MHYFCSTSDAISDMCAAAIVGVATSKAVPDLPGSYFWVQKQGPCGNLLAVAGEAAHKERAY